jgi:hypothetical protein
MSERPISWADLSPQWRSSVEFGATSLADDRDAHPRRRLMRFECPA